MSMALDHAVGPFYAYIIDLWRNQVYDGSIKENELNKKYWKYRLQYQGVCPPVRRSEKNFDIGAKYHIAAGVEYWRYFVANILQFQLHEYLCRQTGHKGPVHNCTIYKKRKAGKRLAKLLRMGKSRCWKRALKVFSSNKIQKLDGNALLRYFNPLMLWLKKQNKKEHKGWRISDPMICPGVEDTTENTAATKFSTTKSLTIGTRSFTSSTIASSGRPQTVSATASKTFPSTKSTNPATGKAISTPEVTVTVEGATIPTTGSTVPGTGATIPNGFKNPAFIAEQHVSIYTAPPITTPEKWATFIPFPPLSKSRGNTSPFESRDTLSTTESADITSTKQT
ncbi:angiotensin-converting enzyme [Trichonephila clavata]|uniref:Angiotensin-converting enzyme n=1 Tax=Trichonephila clavata TaxID=2740835 RepID=A0A8X6KCI9_TRICU|nr:angiotensin-converting enzyme [Trichonephila clavata]